MHKWLKKQKVSSDENSLLVIENTGVYHRLVWEYCSAHGLPLYIGNATHIKYSFGIASGKNDKIDSRRLCAYAFKNADELKATPVLNPIFIRLKDMMTARSRLLARQTLFYTILYSDIYFETLFFYLPCRERSSKGMIALNVIRRLWICIKADKITTFLPNGFWVCNKLVN